MVIKRLGMWLDSRTRFELLLLTSLVFVCYFRTTGVPFYFDDFTYILENPFVKTLGGVFDREAILRSDLIPDLKNSLISRPLAYFSFAFNYWIHQDSAAGYHLLNILIHLANVILVYLLIRTMAAKMIDSADASSVPCCVSRYQAVSCAALFAVHPVMTSAVTYVTQRMASLSAMLCLLCVASFLRSGLSSEKNGRLCWYVSALICCAFAMKVRESSYLLPWVLLLTDICFCSGTARQRSVRLLPFFCILLGVVMLGNVDNSRELSLSIQSSGPTTLDVLKVAKASPLDYFSTQFATNPNMTSISSMSPYEYLLTQLRVIISYQRMLLVPVGLNLVHDYPFYRTLTEPVVLASLLFHLAILWAAIRLLQQSRCSPGENGMYYRLAAFGILWFYLCLAMESSIIPMDDLLLEHRMYLPAFGFLIACVSLLQIVLRSLPAKAVVTIVVVMFAVLTVHRNEQWRDPLVFWQDALAKSPGKKRIHGYIGNVYRDRGDMVKALKEYRMMLANDFRYGQEHFELGELLLENGMCREAVEEYLTALKIRPGKTFIHDRLAEAYRMLGEDSLAAEELGKAGAAEEPSPDGRGIW